VGGGVASGGDGKGCDVGGEVVAGESRVRGVLRTVEGGEGVVGVSSGVEEADGESGAHAHR
jgi:hypothetical protein